MGGTLFAEGHCRPWQSTQMRCWDEDPTALGTFQISLTTWFFFGTWHLQVNDLAQHREIQWSNNGTSPIKTGEIDGHAGYIEYTYLRASWTPTRENKKKVATSQRCKWRIVLAAPCILQYHSSCKSEPRIEFIIPYNHSLYVILCWGQTKIGKYESIDTCLIVLVLIGWVIIYITVHVYN